MGFESSSVASVKGISLNYCFGIVLCVACKFKVKGDEWTVKVQVGIRCAGMRSYLFF